MAEANRTSLDKELIHTLKDGTKVFRVNGRAVRDNHNSDFTEGGHGYVPHYGFIPKNEIWVERMLDLDDEEENLAHELVEYVLMRYGKMDYNTAHEHALEMEAALRKIPNDRPKGTPAPVEPSKTEEVIETFRRLVG